jgi:predicted aminopeptidase
VTRVLALLLLTFLAGCDTLSYYGQAVSGHLEIMNAARPVDDWLADPATPAALRKRLELAQRIRRFASAQLALPDNRSYTKYAELHRPFAVWNVFAAPEFSVSPKRECFPVTGCVAYRGFFSEKDARAHAGQLKSQGYDVYVGGVPAYSTLGWFDDPLLSTFIGYSEPQLARLVFHELAHQVVYAPHDTAFNESFAVTVEQEGVKRWLEAEGRAGDLEAFRTAQARRERFASEVKETRARLATLYAEGLPEDQMRQKKAEEFARLRALYPAAVPAEPNNAFLVSVALYTELVPDFEKLLHESGGSLEAFYAKVKELAKAGGFKRPKPPGPAA